MMMTKITNMKDNQAKIVIIFLLQIQFQPRKEAEELDKDETTMKQKELTPIKPSTQQEKQGKMMKMISEENQKKNKYPQGKLGEKITSLT